VEPNLEENREVTPGRNEQIVEPSNNYEGLKKVTVHGDEDLIPSNIVSTANIFGVQGAHVCPKPKMQPKSVTPNADTQTVRADSGYDGLNEVVVWGDANLKSENIVNGVTIFNVKGSHVCPEPKLQSKTITKNGTFEADTGYDGFGTVTVDVPEKETNYAPLASGSITSISAGQLQGATKIRKYAFCDCVYLTSVTIPNTVSSIWDYAFQNCGITSITIPTNVQDIGDGAFCECYDLTTVTFSANSKLTTIGVQRYGLGAFYHCDKLTSITIPASVKMLGCGTFEGCTSLASITFGATSQLTSICDYAFKNCKNLKSITIPVSVSTIGESVFTGCSNLTSVVYKGTTAQWYAINKATSWDDGFPATQVQCTNGTVSINKG
jgi:hypothetical protein